ncbi:MAG: electron transporter RnfC [Desulfovibrionaceae bacterium]|nr:electron transporter RnfC [Desulfovibrionaceae bacterium]
MKELFTMLTDPRFHLVNKVSQRFSNGPEPSFVRLTREGFTMDPNIRKKTRVHPYMHLASHPSIGKGDLFSPMYGEITDITELSVFIKRVEPDEAMLAAYAEEPETDVMEAPERGQDLAVVLKRMGLNTRSLGQQCETLVVNCLNPDPGVNWAEPMLLTHQRHFLAGMEMLRRLSPAKKIILAVPEELKQLKFHGVEVVGVPSHYPASINALVVRAVTGRERPEGVGVVGLHNVWSLGRVAVTRRPLIDTVITIGSLHHNGNYIVRDGSTVGELFDFAGVQLNSGDTIVRGGPLRGESIDRLDRSITKGAIGLFLVEKGSIPPMEGHSPCVSCGSCVAICPARLRPDLLSRYAEFGLHKRSLEQYIDCCLECGLCGYVCINRRPVLQYIRLSKAKLGINVPKPQDLYYSDIRPAKSKASETAEEAKQ